jgi:hypothetical protein
MKQITFMKEPNGQLYVAANGCGEIPTPIPNTKLEATHIFIPYTLTKGEFVVVFDITLVQCGRIFTVATATNPPFYEGVEDRCLNSTPISSCFVGSDVCFFSKNWVILYGLRSTSITLS